MPDGRAAHTIGNTNGRRRTVLYIEDQPANVRLLERLFERRPDLDLVTCRFAMSGIEVAVRQAPDLILLDLHLPDLDGEAVLAQLRGRAETAGIPVVVLSADARSERIDGVLAAGAARFLTKPLDLMEVLDAIDACVDSVVEP